MAASVGRVSFLDMRALSHLCRPRKRRRQWAAASGQELCGPCHVRTLVHGGDKTGTRPSWTETRLESKRTPKKLPWTDKSKLADNPRYEEEQGNNGGADLAVDPDETVMIGKNEDTFAFSRRMEELLEGTRDTKENDDLPRDGIDVSDGLSDFQYHELNSSPQVTDDAHHWIKRALVLRQPDRLLKAFIAHSRTPNSMQQIPDTAFSEILDLIRPENLVKYLFVQHLNMSKAQVKAAGIMPMRGIVSEYLEAVLEIIALRRDAGHTLGLSDFSALLAVARGVHNLPVAQTLWKMMEKEEIIPDAECYNHYLAALAWYDATPENRYKSRVTESNMLARIKVNPRPSYSNYRVWDNGVKEQTMRIFDEMLKNKLAPEEETFCHVITALAREGDVKGLQSMLEKVWGIDVPAIMRDSDQPPRRMVDPRSPLYPSDHLLHTVAFAFCINSDLSRAIRTVDHVMRHYKIEADHQVWKRLFDFTFQLSAKSKSTPPILPMESVESLWKTMTASPYNVEPTVEMYDLLIKNMWFRKEFLVMANYIHEASALVEACRLDRERAWEILLDTRLYDRRDGQLRIREEMRRDWEEKKVIRKRHMLKMRRWMNLLLSSSRVWTADREDWTLNAIPSYLGCWVSWLPTRISYESRAGLIEILVRTDEEMDLNATNFLKKQEEEMAVLNTENRLLGREWVTMPKTRNRLRSDRNSNPSHPVNMARAPDQGQHSLGSLEEA